MQAVTATYTGKVFDLMKMQTSDVDIHDIAHALAHTNRFCGHTRKPYSVAEHCVHVSKLVPPHYQLRALLHDASEAYLSDLNSQLKATDSLAGYRYVERNVQLTVYQAFGLFGSDNSVIHTADRIMLGVEARDLMPVHHHWKDVIKLAEMFGWWSYPSGPQRAEVHTPMCARQAESVFLSRWLYLKHGGSKQL